MGRCRLQGMAVVPGVRLMSSLPAIGSIRPMLMERAQGIDVLARLPDPASLSDAATPPRGLARLRIETQSPGGLQTVRAQLCSCLWLLLVLRASCCLCHLLSCCPSRSVSEESPLSQQQLTDHATPASESPEHTPAVICARE